MTGEDAWEVAKLTIPAHDAQFEDRWPYLETKGRKASPFTSSWSSTLELLDREITALKVRGAVAVRVVGAPTDVRRDGMLRASARLGHPGVAISFESMHGPLTYPCDRFVSAGQGALADWQVNVRAIALGLEALRRVERYGITSRGEQYAGWRQIEASSDGAPFHDRDSAIKWLCTLAPADQVGYPPVPSTLLRIAKREAHPDRNGGRRGLWDLVEQAEALIGGVR